MEKKTYSEVDIDSGPSLYKKINTWTEIDNIVPMIDTLLEAVWVKKSGATFDNKSILVLLYKCTCQKGVLPFMSITSRVF